MPSRLPYKTPYFVVHHNWATRSSNDGPLCLLVVPFSSSLLFCTSPPKSPAYAYLERNAGGCGKSCIEVVGKKIRISEMACAACLLRAKRTPDNAVRIVKLPVNLEYGTSHRYGVNAFRLNGLPTPRPGMVLGILGSNGTGKSTALGVLSGKIKPNLGQCTNPATWQEIIKFYRGSDLQNYFQKLANDDLTVAHKPQMDSNYIRRMGDVKVGESLERVDQRGVAEQLIDKLSLRQIVDRKVRMISGGELQRLAIALVLAADADVYIFDEPSSFLDLKQRLEMSDAIQSLLVERDHKCYVMVVEHDLTVLNHVSDAVCCLYGEPGAYGVVSQRVGVRNGINQFLKGFLPGDNVRFRADELTFWASTASAMQEEVASAAVGGGKGAAEDGGAKIVMGADGKPTVKLSNTSYPAMEKVRMPEEIQARERKEQAMNAAKMAAKDGNDDSDSDSDDEGGSGGGGKKGGKGKGKKGGKAAAAAAAGRGAGGGLGEGRSADGAAAAAGGEAEPQKPSFRLRVEAGTYAENGQVVVLLGENGTGKSTFIEMLAQHLVKGIGGGGKGKGKGKGGQNGGSANAKERLAAAKAGQNVSGAANAASKVNGIVSVKRQHPLEKARRLWGGTVREFLDASPVSNACNMDRSFRLLVMNPLKMEELMDLPLKSLSGGELQRLAVVVCLGTPAQIFLLDEPSAALDVQQRVAVAKVIKRWVVNHSGKTAFVVEHDFSMSSILADRVIVFSGKPGVDCTAGSPQLVETGFNQLLKQLNSSMRLDPDNGRPVVNKRNSAIDRAQKSAGQFYQFDMDPDI